ncbi:DUF2784 domain-containing protein [Aliikangiella coralliicola]|uniref:DUF2784 domain-containing protein n=1 Tax=Aliikangiella coralliicola TaxID=2592383 RepID=A0A545UG74_9GAMM|nr:DUF2784 domain-containing protein [Aliikangiella coralliicola]TQV88476.1 DUF2784 domain-containing protein [Aliikangiella coralliicola]
MLYRILADIVVIIHLFFILFVLFGGLLVLWRRWLCFIHLPAFLWGVLLEFNGWICPLTPLENMLRISGNSAGYSGGFVEFYVLPVIYPTGLTHDIQLLLGAFTLLVNGGIYAYVIRHYAVRRKHE